MADIYFSMIVYVDNDELLKKSIDSIVGPQVKIIVVDAICSEISINLCAGYKEKYGERFKYFKTFGMSIGEAYNVAIPEIEGQYVNFSLASTWFSRESINAVRYIAENEGSPKLVSLSPWTVNEKEEDVQYKMSPVSSANVCYEEIYLDNEPKKLQLMFHSYFIRCYLINSKERHMWFKQKLLGDAVTEMLLQLLSEIRGYLYLPKQKFYYTYQMEDNVSACVNQQYEWWYLDSLKNWILPFVKEWNSKDYPLRIPMKIAVFYLIYSRFNCNYNNRNKGVLNREQVEEFIHLVGKILQYIDNKMIYKKDTIPNFVIPRGMRILFLKIKAAETGKICENVLHNGRMFLWTHYNDGQINKLSNIIYKGAMPDLDRLKEKRKEIDASSRLFVVEKKTSEENFIPVVKGAYEDDSLIPVCELSKEHVILKIINYINGNLEIDGILSLGDFLDKEQIKLFALYNGQTISISPSEVYGLEKIFGITYEKKYMFHVSIPVYSVTKKAELQFAIELNEMITILEIRTQSVYSHVRSDLKGQYWRFENEWCLNFISKNKMCITMVTENDVNKMENTFQKNLMVIAEQGNKFVKEALDLRKEYFKRKQQNQEKKIWITFDKLYKAGDNGEYIYNYISQNCEDIDIYYIVKEDSLDYKRMKNENDNILKWGDKESLVLTLLADVILATHADVFEFTGFNKEIMPYICDLFNPINICIQHGLTVQNIANFQNRLIDNIRLYLCASQNEIDNLSYPIYGYNKENLSLTGLARFDGLKNNDQYQILIAPTWRRGLAVGSNMGSYRGHSNAFKQSEYFQIYNRLINDSKLISVAKETGYKIIYLLHPVLTAQICDFDQNNDVEIMTITDDMSYEKILTESSLMITDYSGVQFDFAYMRKPLLYYHPKSIPPHFDESKTYVYENDAFGPIIDNHEELVNTICVYMRNQCKMKEEYRARADRFFAYSDFENCSRIYNAIRHYIDE